MQQRQLFEAPLPFLEGAGALQHNRRLIGEQLEQVDVGPGEGQLIRRAGHVQHADQLTLPDHRRADHGREGTVALEGRRPILPGVVVRHDHRFARQGHCPGHPFSEGQLAVGVVPADAEADNAAQSAPIVVGQVDPPTGAAQQIGGLLTDQAQQRWHVPLRDHLVGQLADDLQLPHAQQVMLLER